MITKVPAQTHKDASGRDDTQFVLDPFLCFDVAISLALLVNLAP